MGIEDLPKGKLRGLRGLKSLLRPLGIPAPPDPEEAIEILQEVVNGVTDLKDVPKTILEKVVEADEDFRGADKAFRGTRIRKGKR